MQKMFCDFCEKELSEADESHDLKESTVYENRRVGVRITVIDETSQEPVIEMCSTCLFNILDHFDPRDITKVPDCGEPLD